MTNRSTFWILNLSWALVAGLVAANVPERIYGQLLSWNLGAILKSESGKPPDAKSEAEVRAALEAAAIPSEFVNPIVSLHLGNRQKGIDATLHEIDTQTGIRMEDGLQIYELVRNLKPQRTLEIGFAHGVSTLYFLAALRANGSGVHVAVDPYEIQLWKGIGLMKVKEVKMEDSFQFISERSHPAMTKLGDKGLTFDVMFIDGSHLYDTAFADFVLADALCLKGGYILLHDTWMGSIQRIISFIEKNRIDFKRQPSSTHNIAVFQKIGDDKRPWHHFNSF
jgi:predicted O-methyltransferase YrrM